MGSAEKLKALNNIAATAKVILRSVIAIVLYPLL
jgi:hypothetical protein